MSYATPNILPSGMTFGQWQAAGLSGHLEKLITANSAGTSNPSSAATISLTGGGQSIANPTAAATVTATGGGQTVAVPTVQATVSVGAATTGSLAAGTYYVGYTFVTPTGETTMGAGSPAASVSAQFTQVATRTPTVTLPSLASGASSMNIYLSNTNGANTALVLYATGVTGTTFVLNSSLWNGQAFAGGVAPPASNTTTGNVATAATGNYFGYTWVHAHGETTLGASVSSLTAIAAGNVPQVTIPSLPTGALSASIYMSNTNGTNTALKLIAKGVTTTTVNINISTWNGVTFANGTVPPAANTTIGALPPGAYLLNFTETNGIGETTVSTESASFTVASQSNPTAQTTGSGSGTTGSLAAGIYYGAYTWVDNNGGETTIGSASATESTAITISATNVLTLTFNDTLPGWAVGRNVYLTAAGGAAGSETLYATGVTTSTLACTSATFAGTKGLPTANTTSVDIPRVTLPALQSGNTARSIYLTAAGGATGTEVLYATGVPSTTTTFDLSYVPPSNSYAKAPPTVNSTAFSYAGASGTIDSVYVYARAGECGNAQMVYNGLRQMLSTFNHGDPIPFQGVKAKFSHYATVYAMMAQLCNEAGALIDANPGTIRPSTAGNFGTVSTTKRTWP